MYQPEDRASEALGMQDWSEDVTDMGMAMGMAIGLSLQTHAWACFQGVHVTCDPIVRSC